MKKEKEERRKKKERRKDLEKTFFNAPFSGEWRDGLRILGGQTWKRVRG